MPEDQTNDVHLDSPRTGWLINYVPNPDSRVRLICAHHAGGSAQYFENWPEHLNPEYELLAINLPGRGSRRTEACLHDLGEVVESLIGELLPYLDRPYALFGDSVGALICFEITRGLRRLNAPLPMHLFASGMVAPQIIWWDQQRPLHQRSDAELFDGLVRDAGMLDEVALANSEIREVMIPVLRDDLEMAESYRYRDELPLSLPVTAMRGDKDILLTAEQLEGWSAQTDQSFEHLTFPGSHFYSRDNREAVLDLIQDRLKIDLEKFPSSIVEGPVESYPDQCLHDVFSGQAKKTPNTIALAGSGRQYSYAELDTLTDDLARWLITNGVTPGELIGILMERCVEHVIALIAINKAGAVFMPLETSYPSDLLRRFVEASEVRLLLSQSNCIENLPQDLVGAHQWIAFDEDWRRSFFDEDAGIDSIDLPPVNPADTAFMSMSSGTSGAPKGICQSHRACLNAYWHRYLHAPYDDQENEACHVYFIWYVWLPLLRGVTAWIVPADVIYDPPLLVDFIEQHRITRSTISPSLLEQVLKAPNLDLKSKLGSLKNLTIIGEVVPMALVTEFFSVLPQCTLTHAYGCAETHDAVSRAFNHGDHCNEKVAPVGYPQINQRLFILDQEGEVVPRGVAGEVFIGGDSLANGYFRDDENTRTRFVPDPVRDDSSLLFKTGDRGRVRMDGELQIFGRLDSMVKLRGYSVMLPAVENALLEHPQISNAVVIAAVDAQTGRPDHLIAYVVATSGATDEIVNLRKFLSTRLPHYALPAFVVPLSAMPVDARSNSKIDRRALPPPGADHRLLAAEKLLPRHQGDRLVLEQWQAVLAIEDIGIDDDFFALGGHSLLAAELCGRLNQHCNTRLRVVEILQHPSVAQQADLIESRNV